MVSSTRAGFRLQQIRLACLAYLAQQQTLQSTKQAMKKYNIFEDKNIELSKLSDGSSCSLYKDRSSFLQGVVCQNFPTRMSFSFIACCVYDEVRPFFVTITARKSRTVFYGHDSTASCIIRCEDSLRIGTRHILYGKLSKINSFFMDCLGAEALDYKVVCHWLL